LSGHQRADQCEPSLDACEVGSIARQTGTTRQRTRSLQRDALRFAHCDSKSGCRFSTDAGATSQPIARRADACIRESASAHAALSATLALDERRAPGRRRASVRIAEAKRERAISDVTIPDDG
jgi:hypothetical protein